MPKNPRRKRNRKRHRKGLDKSGYRSYQSMLARCHHKRDPSYAKYGAIGISVCERWKLSYEHFVEDMGPRPEGTTLDRIDNSKGYEPGNCRWADWFQQANNRSNNISRAKKEEVLQLRIQGFSYQQIADRTGVSRGSAHLIIKKLGYDPYVRPAWEGSFKDFMEHKAKLNLETPKTGGAKSQ